MKKIARILVSLFGGGFGIGLLYLAFRVLAALDIIEVEARVSGKMLAVFYGLAGLLFMAIFFFSAPAMSRKTISTISKIENRLALIPMQDVLLGIAGLMIGLILALLLSTFISRIPIAWISIPLSLFVYIIMGYLGVAVAVKRTGEVRLLRKPTPPSDDGTDDGDADAEFLGPLQTGKKKPDRTQERSLRNIPPKILDTSVIIDGRIYDIVKTGVLEGRLIAPSFVLQELRHIADSSDSLRRQRGRRGLDILGAMQSESNRLHVVDKDYENMEVDEKLIMLAKDMKGKIVTNDFNLNKVATVKGVEVININQLANALKPAVMPGEEMATQIIRSGKEQGQGVAYLDDGTMIVVDGGREHVGQTVDVVVTSVLQTAAGRMVFAKVKA
jgi:uncharacterized protein YacL